MIGLSDMLSHVRHDMLFDQILRQYSCINIFSSFLFDLSQYPSLS